MSRSLRLAIPRYSVSKSEGPGEGSVRRLRRCIRPSVKTRTPPKRKVSEVMSGLEEEVAPSAMRLKLDYPDVGAILFTCVGFSCVAPKLRQKTGLPVYSITGLCRLTMASLASR